MVIPNESMASESGYEVDAQVIKKSEEAFTCLDENDEDEAAQCKTIVSCSSKGGARFMISYFRSNYFKISVRHLSK